MMEIYADNTSAFELSKSLNVVDDIIQLLVQDGAEGWKDNTDLQHNRLNSSDFNAPPPHNHSSDLSPFDLLPAAWNQAVVVNPSNTTICPGFSNEFSDEMVEQFLQLPPGEDNIQNLDFDNLFTNDLQFPQSIFC